MIDVGFLSYSLAAVAFLILAGLMLVAWRGRLVGGLVILSALLTSVWALSSALVAIGVSVPLMLPQVLEYLRNISWIFLLLSLLSFSDGPDEKLYFSTSWLFGFWLPVSFLLVVLFVVPTLFGLSGVTFFVQPPSILRDLILIGWVSMPIAGLLLVEQVIRNASVGERWIVKYLCIGIGLLFVYDFFMYADALLYKKISRHIFDARGYIVSLSVPLIAVAIARNPTYDIRLHVSRGVVFHSATILGAGIYLLLMAIAGYFVRLTSASYGSVFQIIFLFGSGLLLAMLLFSDSMRARGRVFLNKHFFSYKHDYRAAWLNFTEAMSEENGGVPERVIRAMSGLVESGGGILFEQTGHKGYRCLDRYDMARIDSFDSQELASLGLFFNKTGWVVNIDEYNESSELYENLQIPDWLVSTPNCWLLVPLIFKSDAIGFVLLRRSGTQTVINWEDLDLLKMAGKQAAIHLAQYQADKSLMEAHQFDSFNRLSAYVVHDLKNILAQQSLLLSNAEKHKSNPDFVDDVFLTIENSVERMHRLMRQMKDGLRGEDKESVQLSIILQEVVASLSKDSLVPSLQVQNDAMVNADKSQLKTVFSHIVQNAQEAISGNGLVTVMLGLHDGMATVTIIDNGKGMDEVFIRDRLFKPFDSTKGLMGMGVGVYESREFVRSMGGDITVKSSPGSGTTFSISLPSMG